MKLRQIIRDYFTFTKNERIGLVILLTLIVIALFATKFIYYFESPGKADQEKFQKFLSELEKQEEKNQISKAGKLFRFDPNTIDSLALDSLSLPARVKHNLLKYRQKGGHFYKANDLRKIYGMNDSLLSLIGQYVQIVNMGKQVVMNPKLTSQRKIEKTRHDYKRKTVQMIIEINAASADDLTRLRGIGPILSKRIIKYRNLLGGFCRLDQLSEVYGLKQETIENIIPYLSINTQLIEKVNVNFAEPKQLTKHPYISWVLANAIVDFRSKNGFINDIQVLRTNNVIDEKDFQRISPYLKTKD